MVSLEDHADRAVDPIPVAGAQVHALIHPSAFGSQGTQELGAAPSGRMAGFVPMHGRSCLMTWVGSPLSRSPRIWIARPTKYPQCPPGAGGTPMKARGIG